MSREWSEDVIETCLRQMMPYRDCPANYRPQADGAIPRCLRSEGHPHSHVSLFEDRAIFWDTKEDGTIVDRGNGKPSQGDEPNELSG